MDLYVRKLPSNTLKTQYCAHYQITSRQYNSIKNQLDGRIKSFMEKRTYDMTELQEKIAQLEETIEKKIQQKKKAHDVLLRMKGNEPNFSKKVKNYGSLKQHIHQKKRKLHRMILKYQRLDDDRSKNIVRICFGSKKLFRKQFYLQENNLTFSQWQSAWKEARAAQFTFIGSKDETFGNQTCTYDDENNLRIRVSKKDEAIYGTHIVLPNITFSYGQAPLDIAKIPFLGHTKGKGDAKKYYRALTTKFIKRDGIWYMNMSVDVDMPTITTIDGNGYIGVDFNVNFLAVTEVDRYGNYVHSFIVPFRSTHVTSEQTKQSLSEALRIVIAYALEKQKPIVREELNFKKKKQQLKEMSKNQAKMLSGFAYSLYKEMLDTKCKKAGVHIMNVNPAYTSQIGQHKYMKRYGVSSHESAAMVIARKAMKFANQEKVPSSHIIKGNKDKILRKTRFQQWKEVVKQWKNYTFKQKNYLLYTMD